MSEQSDFTFSAPRQHGATLPDKNPLLAKYAVVDRSKDLAASEATQELPKPRLRPPARPGKVPLEKGYSQMDWLRLSRGSYDLSGLGSGPPRRDILPAELRQHRTQDNAWTVLRGKVYNIAPYLRFHPGGADIMMQGAGTDCTRLFEKYHAWVNADMLLQACFVGTLAPIGPGTTAM